MGRLERIDHIVILMLENRSFDSMLGMLYPTPSSFDGLGGRKATSMPMELPFPFGIVPGPTARR